MKVLWVGDAGAKTGFEYVSRGFLSGLKLRGWDVVQLGIGFMGDPHEYPWRVYPAIVGGDQIGLGRLMELTEREKPDVVVLLNDSWACLEYLQRWFSNKGPKLVVYPPVDAPNQPAAGQFGERVNAVICPTQFGVNEMVSGGWKGKSYVVPYGIDVTEYETKLTTLEARQKLGLPDVLQKAFIVGNVNRNAPRKRLDLTLRAFAEFCQQPRVIGYNKTGGADPYLLLHCNPRDSWGWDVHQLAKYYGISKRLLLSGQKNADEYTPFARMRLVFRALDAQISTTVGEGWGLTTAEGLASEVLNIVPRYSALGEWADGGVFYYGIADTQVNTGQVNTVWAVPDIKELVTALVSIYTAPSLRAMLALKGAEHIRQSKFSWTDAVALMDAALKGVLDATS